MTNGRVRAALALVIVGGSLAIFAFTDKLELTGLLAIIGPVVGIYFGQYVPSPGEPQAVTVEQPPDEPIPVKATPAKKAAKKR
jgi:hypothetical protein